MKTKFSIGTVGPTLIIKRETGIKYCNQVNGCSCWQNSIEGFIYPYEFKHSYYFSPGFWYDQYGIAKNNRLVYEIFEGRHFNDKMNETITYRELYDLLGKGAANQDGKNDIRNWREWKSFCDYLEIELDHIELKVRQDIPSVEAWVEVNTKHGEGIITWENCD